MIMRTHFDSEKYLQQHSTLYIHMNHLEQRNISAEKILFHYFEKLVLHSFNAHVVVLFLTHIDILKHAIACFYLYFVEADAKNYKSEMLYFWKLVATDACNSSLQQVILVNDLVNNQNKSDIFFKVDHLNELLNLELKKLF